MKKIFIFISLFSLIYICANAQTGVEYTIRSNPANTLYEVYMRSNVEWNFPNNITGTGQVTIKVLTSANFQVTMLNSNTAFPGSGFWGDNARVNNADGMGMDYISFGYSGSRQYPYFPGQEVLLFSFNKPLGCVATLTLVDNFNDPFIPNSQGANVGNSLVTLGSSAVNNGSGISNAWFGNYSPNATCVVLPLDLISLTGKVENCKPLITWITANEVDVNQFIIEKSLDGIRWEVIGIQPAVGNTSDFTTYSFSDNSGGYEFYYRLMIVDQDGSFEYSEIIFLTSDCVDINTIHDIYPVPVSQTLNFSMVTSFDGEITFLIFDDLGRLLISSKQEVLRGFNEFNIDTRILANGVYFLQPLLDGRYVPSEKFVKFHH